MKISSTWRSIIALNGVSTLSQIGQFGIGFIILPVWLTQIGMTAGQAGLLAAAQWSGMLITLFLAPKCVEWIGARNTVLVGLLLSIIAFALTPQLQWPLWLLTGALIGMGMGLRWIANETWLFKLTPEDSSGKVVGIHESLIALAGVIAPALPLWLNIHDARIFWIGVFFTVLAVLPLFIASPYRSAFHSTHVSSTLSTEKTPLSSLMILGLLASVAGGLGDGALYGLFPLFAKYQGFSTEQTTLLLVILGIGAVIFQYPIGWGIDRFGIYRIMIFSALLAMIAALVLTVRQLSWIEVELSVLILGGFNSAFLTLGVFAAASSGHAKMEHHMRLISVAFTISSIIGPLIAGFVMDQLGEHLLMWQLAFFALSLMVFTVGQKQRERIST